MTGRLVSPPRLLIRHSDICVIVSCFAACFRRTLELGRVGCLRRGGGTTLLVEAFASSALPRAWSAIICGEYIEYSRCIRCFVLMSLRHRYTWWRADLVLIRTRTWHTCFQMCGAFVPGRDQIAARRTQLTRLQQVDRVSALYCIDYVEQAFIAGLYTPNPYRLQCFDPLSLRA